MHNPVEKRIERLVRKFLDEPQKVDIDDIDRLLTAFGYEMRKKPGSHFVYHKPGEYPITVTAIRHGGKSVYPKFVNRLILHLNLEEWYETHYGA